MRAPAEVIESARNRFAAASQDCDVWAENWSSVMLFLAVATQWTIAPSGAPVGINYVSLESTMNMVGIVKKDRATSFDDVRIMESSALEVFREKAKCQH